jgi:type IV secretion system protein VirB10
LLGGALALGAVVVFAVLNGLSERPDRLRGSEPAQTAAAGPPETIASANAHYDPIQLGGPADLELEPPADPIWTERAPSGGGLERDARVPATEVADRAPDPQAQARTAPILFGADPAHKAGRARKDESVLDARLTAPPSRYALQAGHTIPAALATALNSDVAGPVIAQVTAPVYDSVSGAHLLIPAGSRLIGAYESGVRYGDRRILLVWTRLIFPNGWSIHLREMEASDGAGAAGLGAEVNNRLGRLASAVALSSVISVVANEAEDDTDRGSFGRRVGDVAAQPVLTTSKGAAGKPGAITLKSLSDRASRTDTLRRARPHFRREQLAPLPERGRIPSQIFRDDVGGDRVAGFAVRIRAERLTESGAEAVFQSLARRQAAAAAGFAAAVAGAERQRGRGEKEKFAHRLSSALRRAIRGSGC